MSLKILQKKTQNELNTVNPCAAGSQFRQYKIVQKNWKSTVTLVHGYSSESIQSIQQELSNEYQHDRVQLIVKYFCITSTWTKK